VLEKPRAATAAEISRGSNRSSFASIASVVPRKQMFKAHSSQLHPKSIHAHCQQLLDRKMLEKGVHFDCWSPWRLHCTRLTRGRGKPRYFSGDDDSLAALVSQAHRLVVHSDRVFHKEEFEHCFSTAPTCTPSASPISRSRCARAISTWVAMRI